ncbi:MAG: phospholipase A [Campylobacteraceae bacterium]|jgi:phospholipase A1|nr:phospholipase A [Campylobacteraceae bacterium]
MKVSCLFCAFCTIAVFSTAFGNEVTVKGAYELAEKYESENKTDEALFWYKRAAQGLKDLNISSDSKLEESLTNSSLDNKADSEKFTVKKVDYLVDFINEYEDNETKDSISQIIGSAFGITTYKPNYLLPITYDFRSHEDRKRAELIFQISVRKDLLKNFFNFDEVFGVAYTQRSWWQIMKYSSPFRETNYQPEVYMIVPHKSENSIIKAYKFGFLHESNGQEDDESRSWNRLYFDLFLQYKGLLVNPRVWYHVREGNDYDDNSDIEDYMGYGDLTLVYPYKKHIFRLLVRNNFDFDYNKGAVQFDWTFPIAKSGIFGYIQYFDGYGESLIDYNRQTKRIGIGLAMSR